MQKVPTESALFAGFGNHFGNFFQTLFLANAQYCLFNEKRIIKGDGSSDFLKSTAARAILKALNSKFPILELEKYLR